ncbi:MAG: PAS domain S-box protein [Alphaproteobacteria bacterium]|nr:MAG: PAS domain S-box protein [Alphaproteobacteria bacterium]
MDISDALAEAILSTRSDAIVAADRDGLIRFWNPGAERLFGYSHNEAMSRSLDLIIPERLRERHWDGYRRVMETGKSRYGQGDVLSVPAIRKDGATMSVEFTVVPLQNNGQTIGMAAIMRDVTRRFDEMRALKRKLAELEKP